MSTGRRRARRRSPLRSVRVRAALALGVLLGIGSVSTLAYWTDQATVTASGFAAGTLDLEVNGSDAVTTPYAWSLGATMLVPGESVAADLAVQNAGTVGLTFTATVVGTGDVQMLSDLAFVTYVGGVASNGGTAANGNRVGTCAGTQATTLSLTTTSQGAVPSAQAVAAGQSKTVCVVATLKTTANTADQGKSVGATFTFSAKQVNAP